MALDLDDTLLSDDLTISDSNIKAIDRARKLGLKVTIATGRMWRSTLPFVRELDIDIPVITCQGALITDPYTSESISENPVPLPLAFQIIEESRRHGVHIQVYVGDNYYFDEYNDFSDLYHRLTGVEGIAVQSVEKFLNHEPLKILIMDSPENIALLTGIFVEKFNDKADITISKSNYLEFTKKNISKGYSLEFLAKKFGIPREAVIAVGDGFNDISMIKYAGLGVAMENAPDEVKKHANFITTSHENSGIANVINKFVLLEE